MVTEGNKQSESNNESGATQNEIKWSVEMLKKRAEMTEIWDCEKVSINDIVGQTITLLDAVVTKTAYGSDRRLLHIRLDNGTEVKAFTNGNRLKRFIDVAMEVGAFPISCVIIKSRIGNKDLYEVK